jgi:hypothetical protein
MSQINDIIQDLAAMSVNGITAKYSTTLRDDAVSAVLPYRFISHRGAGMSASAFNRTTFSGPAYELQWKIVDAVLIRAVASGIGVSDISFDVYDYMGEYVSALRDIATNKYVVTDVQIESTLVEWPASSDRRYDAVIAVVTISENN